jgi:hypothetical protein
MPQCKSQHLILLQSRNISLQLLSILPGHIAQQPALVRRSLETVVHNFVSTDAAGEVVHESLTEPT